MEFGNKKEGNDIHQSPQLNHKVLCFRINKSEITPKEKKIAPDTRKANWRENVSLSQPAKGPTNENIILPTKFFTDSIVALTSEDTKPLI